MTTGLLKYSRQIELVLKPEVRFARSSKDSQSQIPRIFISLKERTESNLKNAAPKVIQSGELLNTCLSTYGKRRSPGRSDGPNDGVHLTG